PLWEMNLIDGLEDGHQAVLTKTHHAMLDGVGGMDLAMMLLDLEPNPPETEAEEPVRAEPWPSPVELILDAMVDRVREPLGAIWRTFRSVARSPRDLLNRGATIARGAAELLGRGLAPPSPLNAEVERTRRFAMTEVPLEEARAVGHALGGKVNDVFLTILSNALGRVLEERGEPTDDGTVRGMMPA